MYYDSLNKQRRSHDPLTKKHYLALGSAALLLSIVSTQGAAAAARPPCPVPDAGLVSWWSGNGNPTDRVGPNSGILEGSATFARGKVGLAFSFVGENDSVIVADSATLDPGVSSFSIVSWIKPTGTRPDTTQNGGLDTGEQTIVSKYQLEGGTPAAYFLRVGADGTLTLFLRTASGQTQLLKGAKDVANGKFHHVAAVRDVPSLTLNIYVDGALDASTPLTFVDSISQASAPFRIGNRLAAPFVPEHFTGLIDEVG